MKLICKEHKCTCERVKQAVSAVDTLTDDLRGAERGDRGADALVAQAPGTAEAHRGVLQLI